MEFSLLNDRSSSIIRARFEKAFLEMSKVYLKVETLQQIVKPKA